MDNEFLALIDAWVGGVYRFHLARRGDWLDAETLTAQTFLDAYLSGARVPAALMRLALARQARFRSSGSSSGPAPIPTDPSERGFTDEEAEQNRLIQRARISALGDYWAALDPAQADAVALACFGGLDLPAIARTLRVSPSQVNTWLDSQAEVTARLGELGASIHIPEIYKTELVDALNQVTPTWRDQRWLEQIRQAFSWLAYQARPGRGIFTRLAPVGFVLLLAGFGVWSTLNRPGEPATTPTPPVPTSTPVPAPNLPAVGLMIPPDPAVCQLWQNRLTALTHGSAAFTATGGFNDPAGTGQDFYGTGCFITINATLGADKPAWQKQILDLLAKDGYKQTKQFPAHLNQSGAGSGQTVSFTGQGYSLNRQNDQVVYEWLSAGAKPNTLAGAGPDLTGMNSPTAEQIIIYLGLATRSAHPVVDGFTQAWADGKDSVSQYFTADLRKRLPDLAALDRAAGITRSNANSLKINWKPVENQGDHLRLAITALQISQLALPLKAVPPLQISLSREKGQLKISGLASGVLFNPSGDALVLVDARGQIYSLSLDDGQRTNLSPAGLYPVPAQYDGVPVAASLPPRISPDGKWLFLAPPGDGPAWLLRMDGVTQQALKPRPALFDWAPDSTRFAYVGSDTLNQLEIGQVGGNLVPALWLLGPVRSLAWSPLGDWLGMAYEDPRVLDKNYIAVARLSLAASTTLDKVWSMPWKAGTAVPSAALVWTADQNELWFLPARVSIHLEDRTAYFLMGRPNDQATEDLLATSQGSSTSTSGPAVLSPDGAWFAQVVDNPSSTALFVGHFWVRVRPAAQPDGSPGDLFIPQINRLAWVGNSQSLLLVKGQTGPPFGLAFDRLNPVTQETAAVAETTPARYFLGLKSGLMAASRLKPLAAQVERVPYTGADTPWVGYTDQGLNMSIEFPAGWQFWRTPVNSALQLASPTRTPTTLTLANFSFISPFGFTSLNRSDVTLRITAIPFAPGESPSDWLAAWAGPTPLTPAFPIAGQPSFWSLHDENGEFYKNVLFTTPTMGYSVDWYSFVPTTDDLVTHILATFRLLP